MVWIQDVGELWHMLLGHFHHGALKILQKISNNLPKGTFEQVHTCKGCTLGKYTMFSFHDKKSQAEAIIEPIHLDVCGPFLTAATDKGMYYVIFVDDYSHKCWIFFM